MKTGNNLQNKTVGNCRVFSKFHKIFVTWLVTLFDLEALGIQKLTKLNFLGGHLKWKCKRSSLRSQCWMRPFLRFSNTVSLRFMINYPSQRRCGQSPSNPIDVVSRKPQLPLNSLHFELILHPALLPFHYIHTVLAAFAEAEKRIQEQLCRLSYCTSGEWASFLKPLLIETCCPAELQMIIPFNR